MSKSKLGGRFTFPGTSLSVHRMGYGAMQLAGPGVFGPPKDPDEAVGRAVLIATSRFHHPAHAAEWTDPAMDASLEDVWRLLMDGLCLS
jgi:hypothetical protein